MKQRKVFIGLEISSDLQRKLAKLLDKWKNLPVHWRWEENFHVTLLFLGYVTDDIVNSICSSVKKASSKFEIFDIVISKVVLGPNKNQAKMIWAVGNPSKELKNLQQEIEKELNIFVRDKKEFRPHITLGRIKQKKWKNLAEAPLIDENVNTVVPVESVRIYESIIEDGKRKYVVLEDCPLA